MLGTRRSVAAAAVIAAIFLVQGCDKESEGPSGPSASHTLTVTLAGIGSGTVTSSPAGIDCGPDGGTCSASFDAGTQVTLTATPGQGIQFTGWSGDGSGTTTRTVKLDRDRAVTASFDDPDKARQEVGAQGGTVTSRDGLVTLTVPAGALSTPTQITIEKLDPADLGPEWEEYRSAGEIGAAYEFGPDGLTFASPATVSFRGESPGEQGDTITLVLKPILTSENGKVVPLDSLTVEVDTLTGMLVTSGQVSHFSPMVLFASAGSDVSLKAPRTTVVGEWFKVTVVAPVSARFTDARLHHPTGEIVQRHYTISEQEGRDIHELSLECTTPGFHRYGIVLNAEYLTTPLPAGADTLYRWPRVPLDCLPREIPLAAFHQLKLDNLEMLESLIRANEFWTRPFSSPLGSAPAMVGPSTAAGRVVSAADGGAECPIIMVAAKGGVALANPCTGEVLKELPVAGSENFEAVELKAPLPDRHVLLMAGVGAYDCSLFDNGELGMCGLRSGTYPDAVPISADDPGAGALAVRYPGVGSQIEFMRFRPDWGSFQWLPTFVTIPALDGAGVIRSAVAGGAPAEEFAPPTEIIAVAAMNEGAAKLFHIDLSGATPQFTEVGELPGSDPRRLRCDLQAGICAVSDFSASRITILRWNGSGLPTIAGSTEVGALAQGPVGIDVLDNRIVSAGYDDNRYSLIEVDGSGNVVSVKTEELPAGCEKPGHARFLQDANNTVVVSCSESNGIAVVPGVF